MSICEEELRFKLTFSVSLLSQPLNASDCSFEVLFVCFVKSNASDKTDGVQAILSPDESFMTLLSLSQHVPSPVRQLPEDENGPPKLVE